MSISFLPFSLLRHPGFLLSHLAPIPGSVRVRVRCPSFPVVRQLLIVKWVSITQNSPFSKNRFALAAARRPATQHVSLLGRSVLGRLVGRTRKAKRVTQFQKWRQRQITEPANMKSSSFHTQDDNTRLANGLPCNCKMWSLGVAVGETDWRISTTDRGLTRLAHAHTHTHTHTLYTLYDKCNYSLEYHERRREP